MICIVLYISEEVNGFPTPTRARDLPPLFPPPPTPSSIPLEIKYHSYRISNSLITFFFFMRIELLWSFFLFLPNEAKCPLPSSNIDNSQFKAWFFCPPPHLSNYPSNPFRKIGNFSLSNFSLYQLEFRPHPHPMVISSHPSWAPFIPWFLLGEKKRKKGKKKEKKFPFSISFNTFYWRVKSFIGWLIKFPSRFIPLPRSFSFLLHHHTFQLPE